jgi:hypothetical protein
MIRAALPVDGRSTIAQADRRIEIEGNSRDGERCHIVMLEP